MVTRKSSLPYPTSPTSPAKRPSPEPFIQSSNGLMVDSADIPPIPKTQHRRETSGGEPVFLEEPNPWNDNAQPELRSDRPLPDFLKPRNGRPVEISKINTSKGSPPEIQVDKSGPDTPRSSIDSDRSKDFWEDEDVFDDAESPHELPQPQSDFPKPQESVETSLLSQNGVKRKPLPPAPMSPKSPTNSSRYNEFASNNPFRRTSEEIQGQQSNTHTLQDLPNWGEDVSVGKRKAAEWNHTPSPPIAQFSGMNIHNNNLSDSIPHNKAQTEYTIVDPWQEDKTSSTIPPPPLEPPPPPPPVPQSRLSPFSEQPPLIPISPKQDGLLNPWEDQTKLVATPSPAPFDSSQRHVSEYNGSLLDRGQHTGVVSLDNELSSLPNNRNSISPSNFQSSLLENDDVGPPLPTRSKKSPTKFEQEDMYEPPEGPPPPKPPRPSVKTSIPTEAEITKSIEQRNETYQIKHFNWFDHGTGKLRRSSMLTQNKNGPCPLLAMVNALILGAKHESQAALDDALRSREQVSLGLIIETLMDELLSRGFASGADTVPDVDELNNFLMRLRTGMNANPRFVPPVEQPPNLMDARNSMLHLPQKQRAQHKSGVFESTPDLRLYGAFSVPLLHGWLPESGSETAKAFARSAPTYEDAQALQFGEEELEYKLSNSGLTPEEQQVWQDINSIKTFLKQYPTQLTPYGLESIQDVLSSGSFAILFRNDHFSTIYKHPKSGQLFTLITDSGYADRDEIIWESLVDISGQRSEFFSGDFMPVSHQQPSQASHSAQFISPSQDQHLAVGSHLPSNSLSPQERQEQHDADFAMALQLQEEEEQNRRAEQARRRSANNSNTNSTNTTNTNTRSSGLPNIFRSPNRTRNSRVSDTSDEPSNRPLIPPRTARSNVPAVTRPSDALDDDAPPAYEEAAKGNPYHPPLGSPLHPASDPSGSGISPMQSNNQLVNTISNVSNQSVNTYSPPPGPSSGRPPGRGGGAAGAGGAGPNRQPTRRLSAYSEQQFYGNMNSPVGGRTGGGRNSGGGPGQMPGGYQRGNLSAQQNDRDRDCIVM